MYKIWDQPKNGVTKTGRIQSEYQVWNDNEIKPYPPCFSDMVWKPTATKINNVYLHGYDDEAMPKISETEAALLYDLLSKIFVYDPRKRVSAEEMLSHPWFHIDDPLPHA